MTFAALAAQVMSARPRLGPARLVCVDGPAGSGKSTFAGRVARALGDVQVVHMDDLYEGWSGLDGVWERLYEWVLEPLAAGRPGRYQRYDWAAGAFAEWHGVRMADALVIEGCGSSQRGIDPYATLRVWVEAPRELRLERGIGRDGEALRAEWLRWAHLEAAHFLRERTRERADLRVDGDPVAAHDPEHEFVILTHG